MSVSSEEELFSGDSYYSSSYTEDNEDNESVESSEESEDIEDNNDSIYIFLRGIAEDICPKCKEKNKHCWCIEEKENWNKSLLRFQGYDMYCLECLECDENYYKKTIKEYEDKIDNEKDENKVKEYTKWIEEWKERLESTSEEVDTAKKFLKTGEYNEYHCVNCEYVHYTRPFDIIFWVCDVCNKQNILFKEYDYKGKGYYYYDNNKQIKYTIYFESLSKMNKRKNSNKHYFEQDDKYYYTDGIKYNHMHDPHNCLDCGYGFSEKNCIVCNINLKRRYRYNKRYVKFNR